VAGSGLDLTVGVGAHDEDGGAGASVVPDLEVGLIVPVAIEPDVDADAGVDDTAGAEPVARGVALAHVQAQSAARREIILGGQELHVDAGPGGLRVGLVPDVAEVVGVRVGLDVELVVARRPVGRQDVRLPVLVDVTIAVVVDLVDAGDRQSVVVELALFDAGVDGGVRVVAVDIFGVSVPIAVDGGLGADGIGPVAVVVDAVATHFGGVGVDGRVCVIAVLELVPPVAIDVGGVGDDVAVFVDEAVAVVVDAIADIAGAGVDGGVRVVAIDVRGVAIAVAVDGGLFFGAGVGVLIGLVVAVAVDAVAGLVFRTRVDVGVRVVAVTAGGGVAVAVVVDGRADILLVHLAVAVIVLPVAGLDGAGVDGGVGVVTVDETGPSVPVEVFVDRVGADSGVGVFVSAGVFVGVLTGVGDVGAGVLVAVFTARVVVTLDLHLSAGGEEEGDGQRKEESGHGNSRGLVRGTNNDLYPMGKLPPQSSHCLDSPILSGVVRSRTSFVVTKRTNPVYSIIQLLMIFSLESKTIHLTLEALRIPHFPHFVNLSGQNWRKVESK